MSDVACLVSAPIIGEARARGLDLEPLVEGLGLGLAHLEDPARRMPWHTFVAFAGRASKLLGDETIEELAADATVRFVPTSIRRLLPRLTDSRTLFTFAPRWWGPWVFHGTRGTCESLPDGRLREVVRILPEYPACPEFLAGLRGTLRAMPRLLNQPDAIVSLEQDGREGEFLITPPPRRARFRRGWLRAGLGSRAARQRMRAERELEELGFVREQLVESQRSLNRLAARLDEESGRLESLTELGRLLIRSDPETDDFESLQSDVVELVRRRCGAAGARLTRRAPRTDPVPETSAGVFSGRPDRTTPLLVGGREIGRLELWGAVSSETLEALLPWIAFTLEYGGTKSLAAHLTRLLSDDVRDWQKMERRLDQFLTQLGSAGGPGEDTDDLLEIDLGAFDLARYLDDLAPRLRELAGDDVRLELDCSSGMRPALFDRSEIQSFIEDAIEILCDAGSSRIAIETRVVLDQEFARFGRTSAELRIRGEHGRMGPLSRSRLRRIVERCDTGVLVADLDLSREDDDIVSVRVCLPMLAADGGALRH